MANQIRLKRASGSDPGASDLVTGELAVRTDSGQLFTKKDDNSVAEIGASSGVSDGDKGDITVSSSGSTWTIDNDAVTYAKMQNVSATNRILGRDSSGAGVIEEITPANLRTMLNVEDGATGDQTASEILTLIKTVDGAGSGLDADTLDGVAGSNFAQKTGANCSGDFTFQGGAGAVTIDGNSDIRFTSGNWTGDTTSPKIQAHGNYLYISGGPDGIKFRDNGNNRWKIDESGHFDPEADSTYDIGQSDVRVRNGYFDTLYGDGSNLTSLPSQTDNNFTTALKNKLDGIASGATNVTNNNQISNGAGYVTSSGNTVIGTDSDINTSGATVIDQLNMTDGVITSHSTRTLTLANLGYTGATNANYITNNNQLTNGAGYVTSDTNTTYSAGGNYGMTLSGTEFRLEDDRRRNSSSADIYTGNTHDYCFFDASHGIRFYTSGSEEMRLENDGDLHVDGNVTAYSTTVSDLRLKKDVEIIKNPLDIIDKLNGYTFTYKKDNKKSAGVVAQEVEKVFPQAVLEKGLPYLSKDEEKPDVYKTVEYDQIVGLLVQAVKELKTEIDELKGAS